MNDPASSETHRVHVTDLGPALRIDLTGLAPGLPPGPANGWEAWAHTQNRRLCDTLATEMKRHGGGFDSLAEWSVAVNRHYDLQDMRKVRTARWREGFGSAITTLPWAHPASAKSVSIQATGYVPKDAGGHFGMRAWQPACLYDCSFLGLAPSTVVELGDASLVYLSGVVAWDQAIQPLAGDDPRAQVRLVLRKIQDVMVEAGGTPADVVRLRPFTTSNDVAQILREECARLAVEQGCPEPTLLLAEECSIWDASSLFTEIQAMGVVGRPGGGPMQKDCRIPGITNDTTRIRRTTTSAGTLFSVADLRAPAGTAPGANADAVGEQVRRVMHTLGLAPADVCLAMAYVSSATARARLEAVLGAYLDPAALHLVHCPPMPELGGGTIKLELTAWQQRWRDDHRPASETSELP